MAARKARSIRRALMARLAIPLAFLVLLAGAAAYGVARHFSDAVLDQWLYDSAIALANRVQWQEGRATVDLPQGAREIIEWDNVDLVFYEVLSGDGARIAGNAQLPPMPRSHDEVRSPLIYEGVVKDEQVHVLALVRTEPDGRTVIVKVAETQQKREALARQVLWMSLALFLLLAAVCASLVWYGIGRGLGSIENAVRQARRREGAARLSPIAVTSETPEEVVPLIDEINVLVGELSSAHELNERFIINAAHQLRTPVATLRVKLESARRENDPRRRSGLVDDAVEGVANMGRMLHQLLTLARATEEASHGISTARTDLDLLAREEVERRVDDALAGGGDLGYDGPGTPVFVQGNRDLIREALVNLIDNALRYAGSAGPITVGVRASPEPELYVEDRGPGIPLRERNHVVDRFYRVPGTPGEGCGLGLAIVTEITRMCGAALILDRGLHGSGLRATIRFATNTAQSGALPERPVRQARATEST